MTGIQTECYIQKRIKQHLLDCIERPEYYNYAACDLVSDYKNKIAKIDEFLSKFDS